MLANPHYDPQLRPFTGCDAPVIEYLQREAAVQGWLEDVRALLRRWLPEIVRENRTHVTVAIGCTGGRHRSVYLAEELAKAFRDDWRVLVRKVKRDQAVRCCEHVEPLVLQIAAYQVAQALLVVDDEHGVG